MTLSSDQAARFIRNLQNAAREQKTQGIATVTQVTTNDQGMPVSAIATIGRETNVTVSLANGIGTITHPGETWLAELQGGATGKWRLVECIASRFLRIADQTDYELPTPQIPDTEHGGLYTESAQAGLTTPDQNPDPITANAALYLYYWHTLPGSYSVFDQHIKAVAYQTREAGFEEWEYSNTVPLYPDRKVQGVTTTLLTTSGTAVGIAADLGYAGFLLQGQPAYWRINSEVMLGMYAAGTIGIVDYTGPGSAVRGEGFTYSTGGRAQPQGGALAEHAIGSTVELLMGQIALPALRPASDYEVKIAFVNQANRLGPWSSVQSFTAWSQDVKPSAPDDLTVEHLSAVMNATWTRVTTDANANLRGDIRRYAVARHTAALAGTLTFAAVAALATIVAGTAYPISNTSAQVPSTQGYGNYIGVAAISDNGLLGDWSWGSDTTPPPNPDPENWTVASVPGGVNISYDPAYNLETGASHADTGHGAGTPATSDPGFKEFVVYRASSSTGGSAVEIGRFPSGSFPKPLYNPQAYYKIVSADWAGNIATLGTTEWKFAPSLYAQEGIPFNGTFQIPTTDLSMPLEWTFSKSASVSAVTYEQSGGLFGNRTVKIVIPAQTIANSGQRPEVTLTSSLIYPFTPGRGYSYRVWVNSDQAGWRLNTTFVQDLFSDDAGTTSVTGQAIVDAITPTVVGWQEKANTGAPFGLASSGRSQQFKLNIILLNTAMTFPFTIALPITLYIDDVAMNPA